MDKPPVHTLANVLEPPPPVATVTPGWANSFRMWGLYIATGVVGGGISGSVAGSILPLLGTLIGGGIGLVAGFIGGVTVGPFVVAAIVNSETPRAKLRNAMLASCTGVIVALLAFTLIYGEEFGAAFLLFGAPLVATAAWGACHTVAGSADPSTQAEIAAGKHGFRVRLRTAVVVSALLPLFGWTTSFLLW